ncbi:MAG: hypothetical protein ACWIPI_10155, partial [Polaribacter sp.]
MKTNLFNWAIKLAMLVGIGYLLSNIITKEVITILILLTTVLLARWMVRIAISILFTLIKWV